jgi:chaperonin GroEL
MKGKQKPGVVFQPQVHDSMQRGIQQMVNAIRPTLGPLGGGVVIDHLNGTKPLPEFLEDGGVIARRIIELGDRDEDVGAMLVRSMLVRQHERVGDGTATTAVLFEAVFNGGLRYIAAGGSAMQFRRHLERALPCLLDALDHMMFPLEGQAALTRMALSLCHDEELAGFMGESFELLGEYGRLAIREGYGRRLLREYVEGSHFYTGAVARALLPEDAEATLRLENPAFFLSDLSIEDHRVLFPVLQAANAANVSGLVIVARSLSEKAVSLLVAHNRMNRFKVIAVKLPGLNAEDRMAALEDLGLLTGAVSFLEVTGGSLENVSNRHFGAARRFWASVHEFGLVGGRGDPRKRREHVRRLQARVRKAEDVEKRKHLQDRIGALLGGSITLWLGGFSEPEIKARKAIAERTALALRAAIEEGVVPGGGIALLNCRSVLAQRAAHTQDADERTACRVLIEALAAPARTIFSNAGYDPGDIMGRLMHADADTVFDVVNGQVTDARAAGIVDSAVVLKACMHNAISTAALALTIDSVVHLARPEMVSNPE